jgi:antitoxin PrlF
MATLKVSRTRSSAGVKNAGQGYLGKQIRTGNSSGFRFEGALFRSHPEFNGAVKAHVIAPGQMLVSAITPSDEEFDENDPVLEAFLAFLAKDMEDHPDSIRPLDENLFKRAEELTKGMNVSIDEDLGDEVLI